MSIENIHAQLIWQQTQITALTSKVETLEARLAAMEQKEAKPEAKKKP